eukprot:scaffold2911_cov414-Prasinococcus_capsulatus_cf.AAC.57
MPCLSASRCRWAARLPPPTSVTATPTCACVSLSGLAPETAPHPASARLGLALACKDGLPAPPAE